MTEDDTRRAPRQWFPIAAAVAVVAFLAAAVFGVLWWNTATGDQHRIAEARDAAVAAPTAGVEGLGALDFQDTPKHPQRRQANAPAPVRNDWQEQFEAMREHVADAEMRAKADVIGAAVHELNVHEGSAAVVAVIQAEDGQQGGFQGQILTQLKREDGAWKVDDLGLTPVG
jgi:Mce-associated membrane protein